MKDGIELPYKELSKFDKFSEFKQISFSKCERNHGAIYLKALWLNNTKVLNEFERFGETIHQIMLNKRTYDKQSYLGYTDISYCENGWLIEPKFTPLETISFSVKGKSYRNKIDVCQLINRQWIIGLQISSNGSGHGSGLSIWDDVYNSKKEALMSGLNSIIKWHITEKCSISKEIEKLAIEKLNELNDIGQLQLF